MALTFWWNKSVDFTLETNHASLGPPGEDGGQEVPNGVRECHYSLLFTKATFVPGLQFSASPYPSLWFLGIISQKRIDRDAIKSRIKRVVCNLWSYPFRFSWCYGRHMIRDMRHTARFVKFSMKYFDQICSNRRSIVSRSAGLPGCLFDSGGFANATDLVAAVRDDRVARKDLKSKGTKTYAKK